MPTLHFNAQAIKGIKPPSYETRFVEYWDKGTPGFGIRVGYTGRKAYIVRYRVRGSEIERRMTIGRADRIDLADARRRATETLRAAENGKDVVKEAEEQRAAITFGDLCKRYIDEYAKPRKKSWRDDEQRLNSCVLPSWEHVLAKDIKRRDVDRLLDEIARRTPIQSNRVRTTLSKLFNWALSQSVGVELNPVVGTTPRGKESSRERVIDDGELPALAAALESEDTENSPEVAALFWLRLFTAQRGGEILRMAWADVNLDTGWWTLSGAQTKNGAPHRVPLTATAIKILRRLRDRQYGHNARVNEDYKYWQRHRPRIESGFVFASPRLGEREDSPMQRYLSKANKRVREASKLDDLEPHDLRRTAATIMARHGVTEDIVKRILNHKSATATRSNVTNVYNRFGYERERRAALESVETHVNAILRGELCPLKICTESANVKADSAA